jgi:hypothetical protein
MATALLLKGAGFTVDNATGSPRYEADVRYDAGSTDGIVSSIVVPLSAGDTLATLEAKIEAAVDAEAARLGIAVPTAIVGAKIVRLR